ncbi:MAG TPA: YlbF family regulator [Clostridiales bacterium]|nr:YlbF family regulator [Clostridiales bacterium]HRT82675.1 YlbF family regulator [Oscillospiraceae bacterium]
MDLIKLTRELGAAIQQDERYLALHRANLANENDPKLNELLNEIRMVQMSYQNEASKSDPDDGKLEAYDKKFNEIYDEIAKNPNMQAFQVARQEVDDMMQYITGILSLCVNGEDPETCEPSSASSCSGECSSCSSCG